MYHLFTVYHPKKKQIINYLSKKKIQTRIIYPYPIHRMKAYKNLKFNQNQLLKSDKKAKGIFSLPLYPELKETEVLKICNKLKEALRKV